MQSTDYGQSHARCQVGVFTVGLLSASPAGVTEDVDVGRPEREALVALDIAAVLGLLGLYTGLVADRRKHLVQQLVVPRGSHAHGDGEDGGIAVAAYAVQGFVPPLELGYAEARDSGRGVHHQFHFLVERQPREQVVGTLLGLELRILVRQLLGVGRQCSCGQQDGQ